MTAAGFGDMLAKYTALADWKLAHLLVDEPYDSELVESIEKSRSCKDVFSENKDRKVVAKIIRKKIFFMISPLGEEYHIIIHRLVRL